MVCCGLSGPRTFSHTTVLVGPGSIEMRSLPAILSQHADEAAFLGLLRDAAVDQPNYALRHLQRFDSRIEAHLDGLRLAGAGGAAAVLAAAREFPEFGELFALAFMAFERSDTALIDEALRLAAPSDDEPGKHRAVIAALGWLEP